jgi:hypothetical protein
LQAEKKHQRNAELHQAVQVSNARMIRIVENRLNGGAFRRQSIDSVSPERFVDKPEIVSPAKNKVECPSLHRRSITAPTSWSPPQMVHQRAVSSVTRKHQSGASSTSPRQQPLGRSCVQHGGRIDDDS